MAVATIGYPVPIVIKPWYWWAQLVGHTAPWDAVRAQLREPELTAELLGLVVGLAVGFAVLSYALQRTVLQREAPSTPLSRWATRVGMHRSAVLLAVLLLLVSHFVAVSITPRLLPKKAGAAFYTLYLCATFVLGARLLAWGVYHQQTAPGQAPPPHLTDAKWLLASLVIMFSADLILPVYEAILGLGIHILVLHGFFGLMFVTSNAVGIVTNLASHSPLAHAK